MIDIPLPFVLQAVSPGRVATEFLPRLQGRENPKDVIEEVYSKTPFVVSF